MMTLFLFVVIPSLVFFLCSLLESVMLSVSHAYIALLVKKGTRSGVILRKLKLNINRPLAAILIFSTISSTVGAMGVGAQVYKLFGSQWIALSSALLTMLTLVFSELLPKTLGAGHWKRIAPFAAYFISGMIFSTYPLVHFLEKISHALSRKTPQFNLTREEIVVLAELAANEGIILKKEAQIIENLLLLNEIQTADILTPRSVITALQKDLTVAEAMLTTPPLRFTRIPVYNKGLDDVIGLVLHDRILIANYTGQSDARIETLMGPIHAVPESKPLADLLEEFINRREHLFEVVDEYGGTAGIVTLEDVLETLLGVEIVDEFDSVDDMRAYAVERWHQKRKERNI